MQSFLREECLKRYFFNPDELVQNINVLLNIKSFVKVCNKINSEYVDVFQTIIRVK